MVKAPDCVKTNKKPTIGDFAIQGRLAEVKSYPYENTYDSLGQDHKDHYGHGRSRYDPVLKQTQPIDPSRGLPPINRLKRYQF